MEVHLPAHRRGYSGLQISLHWLIMVMVVVQVVIGDDMTEMVDAMEEGESVSSGVSLWGTVHYWLGLAILAAMLARLVVRMTQGAPSHAGSQSSWQNAAAAALHWGFYAVLIAVPISGLMAYYGIADVGDLHGLSKPLLIVLVGIHVLAALYNQYIRKDGTLTRMVRPQ